MRKIESLLLLSSFLILKPAFAKNNDGNIPVFAICTEHKAALSKDKEDTPAYFQQVKMDWSQSQGQDLCKDQDFTQWKPISIKLRGNSSLKFAKQQYGIKFVDAQGDHKVEVELLDFPKGESWVLNGSYSDRSYMRNALAYRIGRKLGAMRGQDWCAPRAQYFELVLDGDYKGLFLVIEKISRAKDRLNIEQIDLHKPNEISYAMQISALDGPLVTKAGTRFRYVYPSDDKLAEWQKSSPIAGYTVQEEITKSISAFETALKGPDFRDPLKGYRSYIDVDSFIDFFIMQEVSKNVDGFRRSAHFSKNKNEKIKMGPLWDFDLAFGNLRFNHLDRVDGFLIKKFHLIIRPVFWMKRLMDDPAFKKQLITRYQFLRQAGGPLDVAVLFEDIQSLQDQMGKAPTRDLERWKGKHSLVERVVMRTREKASHHLGHVEILRTWLVKRLLWLDVNFPKYFK